MKAAKEVGQVAKQAYADISNTYQAVLMQDTGWTQGMLLDLTQETAERVAHEDLEKDNEPGAEIEPERGPDPGDDDHFVIE